MTRNQLFTSLNKLCNEMDLLYDINCGGCCFVAACLAENLERNNIPFKVVIVCCPSHYFIKVSDRCINRSDFEIYSKDCIHNYNSEYLHSVYDNGNHSRRWNKHYNRKWNLIVQTKIRALFRKYENSRA